MNPITWPLWLGMIGILSLLAGVVVAEAFVKRRSRGDDRIASSVAILLMIPVILVAIWSGAQPLFEDWSLLGEITFILGFFGLMIAAFFTASAMSPLACVLFPALFFMAFAAVRSDTAPTVPVSKVSVPRNLDSESIVISNPVDSRQRAHVYLLGKRQGASFTVMYYKAKVEGGSPTDNSGWSLSMPRGYRQYPVSIYSKTVVRSNGRWQGGLPINRGTFSAGETYSFSFWFDDGDRAITVPFSFR